MRLIQLQIYYHEELGKKSEENRIRTITKEALRGYMFDRTGKLVVDVGPSFSIFVTPAEFNTDDLPLLSDILELDEETLNSRIQRGRRRSRFSPVRVARDVEYQNLIAIEERLFMLPGVTYDVASKRLYPLDARASHLLGYCKEISESQLEKKGSAYQQGDIIGSTGIEAAYEEFLRGRKGYEFISVNSKGQVIGPLDGGSKNIAPHEGFDLLLETDFDLQAFAERMMKDKQGAIVALDPYSGGVLAMVSKPDFNPAVFSGVTPRNIWVDLNTDPAKPMFNRATMTRYPPGSTLKMLVALAALQEGIIDEDYEITCTGSFRVGRRAFKDLGVHGRTNVVESIQKSCNVFYYSTVLKLGLDKLEEYAYRFGLGKRTGLDIGEETAGLVPSRAYYNRVFGEGKWTRGNVVNLGIGQGEFGVSPLQMAQYVASIANDGVIRQPHAVKGIFNKLTQRIDVVSSQSIPTDIDSSALALIREGMRRSVMEKKGTSGRARIPGISVAGKTGTAQNPHGEDHAWFVGFAPVDTPKIAIAVLVENGGFGGTIAAPIAGYVMEKYLRGSIRRPIWLPEPPRKEDDAEDVAINGLPGRNER
jgi:penicillin-binding protein 2